MESKKFCQTIVLRLDSGEEIVQALADFCYKKKIFAAHLSGIGSASAVTLSTYNVSKKRYFDKEFAGQLEITALVGNISLKNGKPHVHCHITIGDEKFSAFAGHLKSATVSATCEIFLTKLGEKIERKKSEKTGLWIFGFE
ncbi:MAG: DNA-binding protein [Candidatus Diapherotrites archaeon]|nr:DNA-binding protein [Candidatus Diapherotrites archaeon]